HCSRSPRRRKGANLCCHDPALRNGRGACAHPAGGRLARWSDPALGLENLDHAREVARHPDPPRRISRRAPHHVYVSLDHRGLRSRSGLGRRDGRRGSLHHQPGGADRSRGHDRLSGHAPESPLRSPKVVARIAGSLYLLASVCFVVAIAIRSSIEGSGGGSGLIDRIRASTSLFRVSLTIDLISGTFFLLAGMALYLLLRHVDRLAAAAMVVLVAIEIVVIYLSDINLYNVLTIATNPAYIQPFGGAAEFVFVVWLLIFGVKATGAGPCDSAPSVPARTR